MSECLEKRGEALNNSKEELRKMDSVHNRLILPDIEDDNIVTNPLLPFVFLLW